MDGLLKDGTERFGVGVLMQTCDDRQTPKDKGVTERRFVRGLLTEQECFYETMNVSAHPSKSLVLPSRQQRLFLFGKMLAEHLLLS